MFEDIPDHHRVFDTADDPHRSLAIRADQGIYFIDLLNKPRPVPSECLLIPQWFENTGDGLIVLYGYRLQKVTLSVTICSLHRFKRGYRYGSEIER